ARTVSPQELREKLKNGEDFILLDVRSLMEWQTEHLQAPQVKLIPLPELAMRLDELPREKEIIILCRSGVRAYQAQRLLQAGGFRNVKFLDGSLSAWPYGWKA
ncbi:MAG: rhodanese-like domain-containing protein, partial [Dehalococcoidales bacterium]|nr:rhodanese-like domain-containing protein [Dehalococcoidales bacterium]